MRWNMRYFPLFILYKYMWIQRMFISGYFSSKLYSRLTTMTEVIVHHHLTWKQERPYIINTIERRFHVRKIFDFIVNYPFILSNISKYSKMYLLDFRFCVIYDVRRICQKIIQENLHFRYILTFLILRYRRSKVPW